MRIAIISSIWDISQGGAVGIAAKQAMELQKRGHQVFIFGGTHSANIGWSEFSGIKIFKIKIKNYRYIVRSYLCLRNFRIEKEFKKFLKTAKPEIIHFHNLYPYLPFSLIKIAKQSSPKIFFTAHDVMTFSQHKLTYFIDKKYNLTNINQVNYKLPLLKQIKQDKKAFNPFRNIIIRHYLKYLTKIFSVSYELKKALEQNKIKNITVIHNGIRADEWRADIEEVSKLKNKYNLTNKKIILFAGRLIGYKGTKQIALAMQKVIREIPEAILLVLDSRNNYYDSPLQKLPHANFIPIVSIDYQSMKNYYTLADIVVVPSICFDSFPTMNLEAMACKKPVIATIFGGSREIIVNNETGYLLNPLHINELAKKINNLLSNPAKAKQMGERGFEYVKHNFNTENWINEIIKLYNTKY